jgi:hypothetical protein
VAGAWESKDDVFYYSINDSVVLRIYSDQRPMNLETSSLQKGVVLEHNKQEVIGEGLGFGVPLVKYNDKTFFSGTSEIILDSATNIIHKKYVLDTISKKYYKGNLISDKIYRPIHRAFTFFYLIFKPLRFFFDYLMHLRETVGIQTSFHKTEPRSTVYMTYQITGNKLHVKADFSKIKSDNVEEFVVLNEQGAMFFKSYSDSEGTELYNEMIGPWHIVEAEKASLIDKSRDLSFTLWNLDTASMVRGWENVPGRLSWTGLNYIFKPEIKKMAYSILIKEDTDYLNYVYNK